MSGERPGIVCVGFAEWDTELWTNQQHLMSRLASERTVLFVESLGLRRPQLAGRDIARILRRLRRGLAGPRERDGVLVLSPLVLPFHGNAVVRAVNTLILTSLVRRAARRAGLARPVLWGYVPQAEVLIRAVDPSSVVYHCVDDIAEQQGVDAKAFRAAERRFVAAADLVLASATPLADRLRPAARRLVDAPNVADTAAFSDAVGPGPEDAALTALPGPRIVFTGAIVGTKLDLQLIAGIARERPEWSVALVGPVGLGDPSTDVSALDGLSNLHLLGHRRYADLPAVLRAADVGIIPYRVNGLTRSVFPMKVYEYLAAGLPVVSTSLPSIRGLAGEVVFADTVDGFVGAVEDLLARDDPQQRRDRSARVSENSWDARVRLVGDELGRLVAEGGRPPAAPVARRDVEGRRTARLLFSDVTAPSADVEERAVAAVRRHGVAGPGRTPALPTRVRQAARRRSGALDPVEESVRSAVAARREVLGAAAEGPPRLLVRMDEYPHWRADVEPERFGDEAFDPWHAIMSKAGCPHLVAVVPRIADDPMRTDGVSRDLTDIEADRLRRMVDDGVALGLHGLDHRSRHAHPRLHTEFGGRRSEDLGARLDLGRRILRERVGTDPRVLVPPFNTFGARQYAAMSERFPVVTGGPESILRVGARPGPAWWGDAVYLPAYPPLYGTAAQVLPALQQHIERGTGLWTPVVLHWGWEAERGWRDLERLADLMAPYATPWDRFLDEVEKSR